MKPSLSGTVGFFALACMCWTPRVLASISDAGAIPLCIIAPDFTYRTPVGTLRNHTPAASPVAAALLAAEHLSARLFNVFSDNDCKLSPFEEFSTGLQFKPVIHLVQESTRQSAGISVVSCVEQNASFIVDLTIGLQPDAVSLLAHTFGLLVVSSSTTSPALSNKELWPNYARTAPSDLLRVEALSDFCEKMRWKQAVLLYDQSDYGTSMQLAFNTKMRSKGISPASLPLPPELSGSDGAVVMEQLRDCGIKVVLLATAAEALPSLIRAANSTLGPGMRTYTWLVASADLEDILAENADAFGEDARLQSLMLGFVGTSVTHLGANPDLLREELGTYSGNLTVDLRDGIERAGGDAGGISSANSSLGPGTDLDPIALQTYDAVLALALSYLRAAEECPSGNGPTVDHVVETIRSGGVSFCGATGQVAWDSRGEMVGAGLRVQYQSFAQRKGGAQVLTVGSWSPGGGIQDGFPEADITWSNGMTYPDIPSDGSDSASQPISAVIVVAILALFLGVITAALAWRNRRLKSRVHALTDKAGEIDLDSPVKKMLDFLERYQNQSVFSRPSKYEASVLRDLIMINAGTLARPNLDQNLEEFDPNVKAYLIEMGRSGMGENISNEMKAPSMSTVASQASDVSDISDINSDGEKSSVIPSEAIQVPRGLEHEICSNFFIDLVSEDSPFARVRHPLGVVVKQGVESLEINEVLRSPAAYQRLLKYILRIEAGHPSTHYHCKKHAADVTNRLMAIMVRSGLTNVWHQHGHLPLSLAGIIAASVHDFGHPQRSNAFLTHKGDWMAMQFNDQSVAENYALREAMLILEEPSYNFLSDILGSSSRAHSRKKWFRHTVISMVLGTDMSKHFDLLGQFETQIASNTELVYMSTEDMWEAMSEHQRLLTLQIALKVADIGHCALPLKTHRAWVELMQEEFFIQGDLEKEAGMKVSPLMDRSLPGSVPPPRAVEILRLVDCVLSCLPVVLLPFVCVLGGGGWG
mmetsp:Transcript_39647/g.94125  ORF Transcript_39647/g.94125 Transcript_39647/m.94125 type:complete len:986 (+) Transcript_39647:172-3129(+)